MGWEQDGMGWEVILPRVSAQMLPSRSGIQPKQSAVTV